MVNGCVSWSKTVDDASNPGSVVFKVPFLSMVAPVSEHKVTDSDQKLSRFEAEGLGAVDGLRLGGTLRSNLSFLGQTHCFCPSSFRFACSLNPHPSVWQCSGTVSEAFLEVVRIWQVCAFRSLLATRPCLSCLFEYIAPFQLASRQLASPYYTAEREVGDGKTCLPCRSSRT